MSYSDSSIAQVPGADALEALTDRVRDDLRRIAHPNRHWIPPRTGPDGEQALDVLVVGGGQSGLAVGFGLLRAKVDNILVVDQAERGLEGPWLTYARMPTLRSPKDFTGPDLDIPSLTYESWHEARYGRAHWEAMDRIPREDWAAYLLWVRDTVDLPVRNGLAVTDIEPVDELLAVTLRAHDGTLTRRFARRVVLATGQDGLGRWAMPDFVEALPQALRAHTADTIDFAALRGRRVAVLGAGASALDNAAMALEAGAAEVHLFCRRAEPQLIQPVLWMTFAGFMRHCSDMEDAWRWRMMSHIMSLREGFPQPTWNRCARHDSFELHTHAGWEGARVRPEGGVELITSKGTFVADFLICGTGIEIDPLARPELVRCAGNIASWADRYTPPETERNERVGRYPYLGADYSLQEKVPGQTPWIERLHVFSIAAMTSFGASGSSINAMTTAVPKLVSGLTRALFLEDLAHHWEGLQAWTTPQATLSRPARLPARPRPD